MNYSTLFIVGNGFDLAAGYETSYRHYYQSAYFEKLKKNNNPISLYLDKKNEQRNKWADLEQELYNYVQEGGFKDSEEAFHNHFNELRQSLYQFIHFASISHNQSFPNSSLSLQMFLRSIYDEDNATKFISFNYTSIFDVMLQEVSKTTPPIQHVHGSLDMSFSANPHIVLGIDESMQVPEEVDFLYKSNDDDYNNFAFLDAIKDARRIIIFGCSMGESDRWYFEQIFQNCTHKVVEIHAYQDKEIQNCKRKIKELTKQSMATFTNNAQLKIFDNSNIGILINQRDYYYKHENPDFLSSLRNADAHS